MSALALVLHAHLPYVPYAEAEHAIEERWLFEALWASYLPLVELAATAPPRSLTVSLSPPLLTMLRDDVARRRFDRYLDDLAALNGRLLATASGYDAGPHALLEPVGFGALREAASSYATRLSRARRIWERVGGDVPGALAEARARGRIELWTSAASHAYLPGLASVPGAVDAQLALGRALFVQELGFEPDGVWLPECGFAPPIDAALARLAARGTIVDAHGMPGRRALQSARGVRYLARDTAACREVWSRDEGFPGDPAYREFYRDVGAELADDELGAMAAPPGARAVTGLKYWRITDRRAAAKQPYAPEPAAVRAREHAALFVRARLREAAEPVCVAAFDAELFGHHWLEGVDFLAALFEAAPRAGLALTTPGSVPLSGARAEPAASSWGEGGYSAPWVGPATAPYWRHIRAAHRAVVRAVALHGASDACGARGRALDDAIRELCLLEASDWLFMIDRGEVAAYGRRRFTEHLERVFELVKSAERGVNAPRSEHRFLAALPSATLRAALAPDS